MGAPVISADAAPLPPLGSVPAMPAVPADAPAASAAAVPLRRIRKMNAVCVDVVRRTHNASTVYFFVGDHGGYDAGQFITIDPKQFPELQRWVAFLEKEKGAKEGIRAYSMSSIPSEKCVSITVKGEAYDPERNKFPPLLSPFLSSGALKGRELVISGFSGHYSLGDDHADKTDQVFHIASGSGIVPNYAMLKEELKSGKNPSVKHTMLYVNKTWGDIIFQEQLQALEERYSDRLEIHHYITREDCTSKGPRIVHGRPTFEAVQGLIKDPSSVLAFACGAAVTKWERKKGKEEGYEPKPMFMEFVNETMKKLEIPSSRFKKEVFG